MQIDFVENKEARNQYIERLETLDKVKRLFLIPEMNVATTKTVAEYFEVDVELIQKCYQRNKNEIDADGVEVKSVSGLSGHYVQLDRSPVKTTFLIGNEYKFDVPNRGVKCFSKRAILRMAMLLRDSAVAKEVRTQLLNVFEHSTVEQKTNEIDNEQDLIMELGRAYVSKDFDRFALANQNYIGYQNRHIYSLKNDNKALSTGILEWEDRDKINKAVRYLASRVGNNFGKAWKELYDELRYKHRIGPTQRGQSPYIQYVKHDEWPLVVRSLSAICEKYGFSPTEIFEKSKINSMAVAN
jgi:hypothetical protein